MPKPTIRLLVSRTLALLLLALLVESSAKAISIAPPKRVFGSNEVIWFSTTGTNIVVCWADGTVGIWNQATGELAKHFKLAPEHFNPETSAQYLCVSHQRPPVLAVIAPDESWDGDKLHQRFILYAITSGVPNVTNSVETETYSCSPAGFVQQSSILILLDAPPLAPVVQWVDVVTGKVVNRIEGEDDVQTGTIVGLDGGVFVNFCRTKRLIARDRTGREIWTKTIPKDRFAEPGYWPDSPSLPYVVVAESRGIESSQVDFMALALRDGAELWRRREAVFGCLKAISRDGRLQAFAVKGGIELVSLPNSSAKLLEPTVPDCDAVFSDDHERLLCLPALAEVSRTKDERVVTMARKSRQLQVFDTKSGKLVKEIELRHPSTKN